MVRVAIIVPSNSNYLTDLEILARKVWRFAGYSSIVSLTSMERQPEANRWHIASKGRKPPHDLPVLVGVDGSVMAGHWNEKRNLWFCGERPIFPQYWRPMPSLPRVRK